MAKENNNIDELNNIEYLPEPFNMDEKAKNLLSEFKSNEKLLKTFKDRIELLIEELIGDKNINLHNISSRVKDESSLIKKIEKKGGKYNLVTDITDLVGIRIISYFEDDVDKIAKIIETEFDVDITNSVDKRKKDYDKFGYQSLHYIISISSERAKLSEYKKYKDLKAEIQIRSVLQHAWAEMEHDIGYKSQQAIPEPVKRNFSRIAAFLEQADIEFIRIRDELEKYRKELPEKIENEPNNVFIDQDSLIEFIVTSETVKSIDKKLADSEDNEIEKGHFKSISNILLLMSTYYEISNIKNLEDNLIKYESLVLKFRKEYLSLKPDPVIHGSKLINGISILSLFYTLIASTKNEEQINNFFTYCNIMNMDAKLMIYAYEKVSKDLE